MTFLCRIGFHKFREFMHPNRLVTAWQCERCGIGYFDSLGAKKTINYTWEEWKAIKEQKK